MILRIILAKTWVRHFYQSHVGYFLLGMLLCFGFMRATEHLALASFFVAQPENLLFPSIIWILYNIKAIFFLRKLHSKPEFEWLHTASLISIKTQFIAFIITSLHILLPILAYIIFLMVMAYRLEVYSSLMVLLVISILLIISLTINMFWRLRHSSISPTTNWFERWFNRNYNKPLPLLFISIYVKRQGWLLILSKAFSVFLIWIACQAYLYDEYDWRLLGLMCLLANSGLVMMAVNYHRFENHDFIILRQRPSNYLKRLGYITVIAFIFLIPELIILCLQFPEILNPFQILPFATFLVSLPVLVYGLMFNQNLWPERYLRWIFYYIATCFILILYSVDLWVLTALQITICYLMLYYKFERFEYPSEK